MPKPSFFELVRKGITSLVDPEREQRRKALTDALYRSLKSEQRSFSLERFISAKEIDSADLRAACEFVYSRCLTTAWKDLDLTESEAQSLKWVAEGLGLSPKSVSRLNAEKGHEAFEQVLAAAIDDGHIDEAEGQRLQRIAEWNGSTVRELMCGYFAEEGEAFLRGMFLKAITDGELSQNDWHRLTTSTRRLGLTESDLLDYVGPHARAFIEHVLADAKSDGEISEEEQRTIAQLLARFKIEDEFKSYVWDEIHRIQEIARERKLLKRITDGWLPSVSVNDSIELRAGEIVHYHGSVTYILDKQLKSGPRREVYRGTATITDNRLVFSSHERSFILNLRSVISSRASDTEIEVRATGKGAGRYRFHGNERMAHAIFKTAVGRVNQTIVDANPEGPDRHIPRDVRQRVWQRYSGRCVECSATQYLEFDHIIPVAKGGSNTDANVQLLCRKCNLRKSDKI